MAAPESTTPGELSPSPGSGGTSGEPPSDPAARERERLLDFLHWRILRLRLIMHVVYVSVLALQKQNADSDVEVAHVLQRYAGDKVCLEIEEIEKFVKTLKRATRASAG